MSFLDEKQTRYYLAYLFGCAFVLVLMVTALTWQQGQNMKALLFEREQTVVSSLLEQGVEADVIAAALDADQTTAEGSRLVSQAGHTERTKVWLIPALWKSVSWNGGSILIAAAAVIFLILSGSISFLRQKESLYQEAVRVVNQFAEGNFQLRLPAKEPGTVYRLFAAVNGLATALQSKSEMEHRAKEFQKETISNISHQLKTPLAALQMYTEIILEEPDNTKTVRNFAAKSGQAVSRMEQLIAALLKMVRLDAGSITFEKQPCSVQELVLRSAETLMTRAAREKKIIRLSGNPEEVIACDLEWTAEAVGNLIKNALDHTGPDGKIEISWQRSPAMIRLSVTDDGCGIAAEDMHHIFKRFYRSRQSGDTRGAGLGLPLAKAIIEGQGGLITVTSRSGAGTVFTISFLTEL